MQTTDCIVINCDARTHARTHTDKAFSAIMIVGAFVLPEVTCGITEASATRYFVLHLEDFIKADPTSPDMVNGPFPNKRYFAIDEKDSAFGPEVRQNIFISPSITSFLFPFIIVMTKYTYRLSAAAGICMLAFPVSSPPASSNNTLLLESSDNRAASTHPAEPPPTIMTISMDTKTDWRAGLTASGCLKYLGDEKLLTDVKFIFPNDNNESCTGHKLILSMRSAVFEAMFYGPLATEDGEITISDIEKKKHMVLRYVYSDELEVDGDTVLRCLYAAKKYCLDGMVRFCSDFLESSVTIVNG
ncbi:LOW QUALITY PROTEIN: BTBD6-like protein [Mya arenaria]|uniref:BTBD6-like protein n=1 Tax=Mya arenaria TaxID=6604 RepID=A0ABY7EIF0_MYAAR|nr:LOW QUALITY PROTEIN: BTBD6-like protein [Mya arenaria]